MSDSLTRKVPSPSLAYSCSSSAARSRPPGNFPWNQRSPKCNSSEVVPCAERIERKKENGTSRSKSRERSEPSALGVRKSTCEHAGNAAENSLSSNVETKLNERAERGRVLQQGRIRTAFPNHCWMRIATPPCYSVITTDGLGTKSQTASPGVQSLGPGNGFFVENP